MKELFSRRDVIKTLVVGSALSLVGKKSWASQTQIELTPTNDPFGVARVRLADFPAFAVNGGSVRLGSSEIKIGNSGPEGLYYPILINRISATEYVALNSQCIHAGCVVGKLSELIPGSMYCPCHGTEYDNRGTVIVPPEDSPGLVGSRLLNYPTTLANGVLSFRMLDFGFDMTHTAIAANGRMELKWLSFAGTEYEVRFRHNAQEYPESVRFSNTATGPLEEEVYVSRGGLGTAYVAPQPGIYQVAIVMREV